MPAICRQGSSGWAALSSSLMRQPPVGMVGADIAAGERIGWLDSDDWLAPDALARTVAYLDAPPPRRAWSTRRT